MAKVAVVSCDSYDPKEISQATAELVALLGGLDNIIKPGDKVLLKVNMLNASRPERAVTTHPEVLRSVIKEVKRAGGIVTVGDSPGGRNVGGAPKKVFETTGIDKVCSKENVPLILLDDDTLSCKSPDAKLYQFFTIGRAAIEADVVITIPRLKTHGFQMFTGAVKNLFGVIPGLKKAEFHVKVPSRDDFGDMLVDLYRLVDPKLAVMDGVIAMEGSGPSGGDPYHLGILLASTDSMALDYVAQKIIGLDPKKVYTTKAAIARDMLDPAKIEVVGVDIDKIKADDFSLPKTETGGRLPPFLKERLNDILIAKPNLTLSDNCDGCGTCYKNCPVDSIEMDQKKPNFDYETCIRCYCCQELCPTQAIELKNHWLIRGWERLKG